MRPSGPPRWGYGPWGAGRGVTVLPPDEAGALKEEEARLQRELEAIRKRLNGLDTSQT